MAPTSGENPILAVQFRYAIGMNNEDLKVIAGLVKAAGDEELLGRFRRVGATTKADGSVLTEADIAMQQRLASELAQHWPDIPLLGEEMSDQQHQALLRDQTGQLWCLDPLDGTANFASGIPCFGVSLALLEAGEVILGVVYDPVRNECFTARRGGGAYLNGEHLRLGEGPDRLKDTMAVVDFKRLPHDLACRLACEQPYRSQRSFGSVALDWAWLAAGRYQLYLHGGQKLWDYAAGELIAREAGAAGGHLADYAGEWLETSSLEPRIGMAAVDEALLDRWRAWILAQ